MKAFENLGLVDARQRRLARASRVISDTALDAQCSLEEIMAAVRDSARASYSGANRRGGSRARAGRKPRDWRTATGCIDAAGELHGPDLFDVGFRLAIEMAATGAVSPKAAFQEMMIRLGAETQSSHVRHPPFAKKFAMKRPTWSAYIHALNNPPGGAREAALLRQKERRDAAKVRCGIDPRTGRALNSSSAR
jgi:hypothetical protein